MIPEERAQGWARVAYVMELVKNQGDAECGAAFDFLIAERKLAIAEALRERDFEWWEALALVDNVAPTPEAVKRWQLDLAEYARGLTVAEARAPLVALLREAQWGGSTRAEACPWCGGGDPDTPGDGGEVGHAPDCRFISATAGETPKEESS